MGRLRLLLKLLDLAQFVSTRQAEAVVVQGRAALFPLLPFLLYGDVQNVAQDTRVPTGICEQLVFSLCQPQYTQVAVSIKSKVDVSSTLTFWDALLEILTHMPSGTV